MAEQKCSKNGCIFLHPPLWFLAWFAMGHRMLLPMPVLQLCCRTWCTHPPPLTLRAMDMTGRLLYSQRMLAAKTIAKTMEKMETGLKSI